MSTIYKNIGQYRIENKLPKNLEVEVDGYGLYNTTISYGFMCLFQKRYINNTASIDYRKLINNKGGVFENLSNVAQLSMAQITAQIPENKTLVGKSIAILMGFDGNNFTVCCMHKFTNIDNLLDDFIYIFKSLIKNHTENLTNGY